MYRKKTYPHSEKEYIKIIEDFQIQKIKSLSKDKLIAELIDSKSWIFEIIKEDCMNLFKRTGGFYSLGLQDDDLYKLSVDITIMQIEKRYFFDIKLDNNILILHKIKSRITNNMRNYFSPTRKINFLQFQNLYLPNEEYHETFDQIIFEFDLQKINKKTIKNGLRKVWNDAIADMDFDLQDFKELCAKFGFTPLDILLYDPYIVPQMSMEAANNRDYQLVLVFDSGKVS